MYEGCASDDEIDEFFNLTYFRLHNIKGIPSLKTRDIKHDPVEEVLKKSLILPLNVNKSMEI